MYHTVFFFFFSVWPRHCSHYSIASVGFFLFLWTWTDLLDYQNLWNVSEGTLYETNQKNTLVSSEPMSLELTFQAVSRNLFHLMYEFTFEATCSVNAWQFSWGPSKWLVSSAPMCDSRNENISTLFHPKLGEAIPVITTQILCLQNLWVYKNLSAEFVNQQKITTASKQ